MNIETTLGIEQDNDAIFKKGNYVISKHTGYLVLVCAVSYFNNDGNKTFKGTMIKATGDRWARGECHCSWVCSEFVQFKGTITIEVE